MMADPDQLEQMFINLVRNAAEAALETKSQENSNGWKQAAPRVHLHWNVYDEKVVVTIEDNGPGLINPGNVFVPFYTTKPAGSGIGLVLSRQIAEAHGGTLELSKRSEAHGRAVIVTLPLMSYVEALPAYNG